MKELFLKVLKTLGIFTICRFLHRNECRILMYHGITGESDFRGLFNHSGMHLRVKDFDDQMRHLCDRYNVISLLELVSALENGHKLPAHSVVITFDDGYENNYTQGFPVLKKYSLGAAVFISTGHISSRKLFWSDRLERLFDLPERQRCIFPILDKWGIRDGSPKERLESLIHVCKTVSEDKKESMITELENVCPVDNSEIASDYLCLTWEQLKEMHISGLVEIGVHTHGHVIMTRVDAQRAREEIDRSKSLVKEKLHMDTPFFSYPNGAIGDYDNSTRRLLEDFGLRCALLTVEGFNDSSSNLFELNRIGVHTNSSLLAFEGKLSGFYFIASRLMGIIRK
jgi:peptidoglycan/xylan/chitin deacetylase (PgdA/CDA1 family)